LLDVFKSVRRHLAFLSFVVGASLTAVILLSFSLVDVVLADAEAEL
jgi:hypothetical protein